MGYTTTSTILLVIAQHDLRAVSCGGCEVRVYGTEIQRLGRSLFQNMSQMSEKVRGSSATFSAAPWIMVL
jgi:hypothetical protein